MPWKRDQHSYLSHKFTPKSSPFLYHVAHCFRLYISIVERCSTIWFIRYLRTQIHSNLLHQGLCRRMRLKCTTNRHLVNGESYTLMDNSMILEWFRNCWLQAHYRNIIIDRIHSPILSITVMYLSWPGMNRVNYQA